MEKLARKMKKYICLKLWLILDWCVDEDPLCSVFKSWCISANKTRENYMKKACRRTCHMCYEGTNYTKPCRDKEDDCTQRVQLNFFFLKEKILENYNKKKCRIFFKESFAE